MLKVNSKAPVISTPSTSKKNYSLKDSFGKYVVLYFYPKDNTPGCTIETNDFNKLLANFKKLDSSEKQYLLIKMQEIAIPILEEMRNLHQNPNLFAEEIRRCASEYNLGD